MMPAAAHATAVGRAEIADPNSNACSAAPPRRRCLDETTG